MPTPAPPANLIAPYGTTAPFIPQWTSFLPADATAMATGLTPQMLAGIQRTPSFAPPMPVAPPQAQQPVQQATRPRDRLAELMARNRRRGSGAQRNSGGPGSGSYGSSGRSAAGRASNPGGLW